MTAEKLSNTGIQFSKYQTHLKMVIPCTDTV
jgi:hypothetical protein